MYIVTTEKKGEEIVLVRCVLVADIVPYNS